MPDTTHLDLEVRFTATGEDGTVEGVAVRYGVLDTYRTEFAPGAFGSMEGRSVPMLWSHDPSNVIGSWSAIEDRGDGLAVKGKLNLDVAKAREVRSLLAAGDVRGLSVGFRRLADDARPGGGRRITKAHLGEISVVAMASVPGSTVTSIRNAAGAATKEDTMSEHTEAAPDAAAMEARYADLEKKIVDRVTSEVRGLNDRLAQIETRANRPGSGEQRDPDAELERRAFTNYVRYGAERMDADEVRALTVGTDASAGYLAPEAYGSEIVKKLVEFSPVRQYARVISISSQSIKYPRRLTGPTATWTDENTDATESTPTYEQIGLTPYELRTFIDVSNALLEDNAYNLESELVADLAEAFGLAEGSAFVTGNGTGKPKGIVTATGITEVKTGAAATLGTDPASTIVGVYHSLPTAHAQNGVWMMNRTTLGSLRQLKDSNGRFLLVDPLSQGMPTTLLGRPVVEAVDMPDVAAGAFPIVFGDLQGYRIVDRVSFALQRDPFTQAAKGNVRLHARRRVGGDVTHPDRFIKVKVSA